MRLPPVRRSVPTQRQELPVLPYRAPLSADSRRWKHSPDNRILPLRLSPFSALRFRSPDIVRLFWLAQHCFQCLARCCSPAPPPACAGCGFRRPGCDKARVPGRNQGRSPYPTAVISSAVPCPSEDRQRSAALTPATLQPYDFHRLAAGPFPYRNSRPCLASEQAFQLTLTQARLRVSTGATHIHFLRSNS